MGTYYLSSREKYEIYKALIKCKFLDATKNNSLSISLVSFKLQNSDFPAGSYYGNQWSFC